MAGPTWPVQDVLLQEREEGLAALVSRRRPARPIEPIGPLSFTVRTNAVERNWLPLSECTMVPAGQRRAMALRSTATARDAVIRASIE